MNSPSLVSFVDLDDTLFQTQRKCEGKTIVQMAAKGSTKQRSSYMCSKQRDFFEALKSQSLVIPTTARDKKSFHNVDIRWNGPCILNHGGTILYPSGDEDLEWKARITKQRNKIHYKLLVIESQIKAFATEKSLDVRVRLIGDDPLYVVAKDNNSDIKSLIEIQDFVNKTLIPESPSDFYIHFNDNNLAVIPQFLNKSHAVQYVLDNYFDTTPTTLGVGDSISDLDFMKLCDFVITPSQSQIMKIL